MVCRCPADSSYCVTLVQYTPNLQDDSDANYNDHAGRMIKMERGCDKVRRMIKIERAFGKVRMLIRMKRGCYKVKKDYQDEEWV